MSDMATREAYGQTLAMLGDDYKDIVVLDADLSKSTKTELFKNKFPDRFFDMGIAEANMIGTAAGLALCGKIPIASSFAVFACGRAFDQIRNTVAYSNLNVKIAATHAGITVGEDGGTHQSIEDIALMRALPNMRVICPADGVSTQKLLKCLVTQKGPAYIRLGRLAVPQIYDDNSNFEIGKANKLASGTDAYIVATGIMVNEALKAREILKQDGIDVGVVDMHTIKPIDKEILLEISKSVGLIVTAEEHSIIGGLGGAVSEVLSEENPVKIKKVGIKDMFGCSAKPLELMEKYEITANDIAKIVKNEI